MEEDNKVIYLTQSQITRLYDVFDFEDSESILRAWFERDSQLIIEFVDENEHDLIQYYEPDLSDEEGQEKLNYILFGKEKH